MRLSDDLVKDAWARIFASVDGRIAYASLRGVALEVISGDSSALQEHNGRRRFAADLMALAAMEPVNDQNERKRRDTNGRTSKRHGPAGRG